jgi:hypothetical protein
MTTFPSTISGIPCQIEVTRFHSVPRWTGGAHTCPSDLDFYGYTEIEFRVLDRRGRPAAWLERKMSPAVVGRIEGDIAEQMRDDE